MVIKLKDPEIPFSFLEQRKFRQRAIVKRTTIIYLFVYFYFYLFTFQNVNKQENKGLTFREVAEKEWRHLTIRRENCMEVVMKTIGRLMKWRYLSVTLIFNEDVMT